MKNIPSKVVVVLLGVAIIGGGLFFFLNQNATKKVVVPPVALSSGQVQVARIADSGFGKLTALSPTSASTNSASVGSAQLQQGATSSAAPMSPQNLATSGSVPEVSNGAPSSMVSPSVGSVSGGGSGKGAASSAIAMPYPISYGQQYVYKGVTFQQNEAKLDVLKRIPSVVSADQAFAALQQLNLGLVNVGSFGNANLDQLTFSQNQDFGYTITIDLNNGTIGINQNYKKWPQTNCPPNGLCTQPQSLTLNDVPSDSVVTGITDTFLKDHAISTDLYGKPVVQNQWRSYLAPQPLGTQAMPAMNVYIPDSVTVVYPLTLNGKSVYEQGGLPSGLTVTVDIRNSKVSGVSGLNVQNYQSSSYDAITEVQKILQIAEQGGQYGVINYGGVMSSGPVPLASGGTTSVKNMPIVQPNIIKPPQNGVTEIDLGTPQMAYEKMYNYQNGSSDELYVPAFVFPIINPPQNYYQQNVIVPLIWDLLPNSNPIPMMGAPSAGTSNGLSGTGVSKGAPAIMPTTVAPIK